MEVVFLCLQGGRKYYSVSLSGERIFVGTRPECARFMKIHEEKVAREQEENLRTPRSRPYHVQTFSASRLHA
jgi:hypothetical protein